MDSEWVQWDEECESSGGADPLFWPELVGAPDLEFVLATLGAKPAAKLEDLPSREVSRYCRLARQAGLVVREVPLSDGPEPRDRGLGSDGTGPVSMLFVGPSATVLEELVHAERVERQGGNGRSRGQVTSGHLLGYPDCCTTRFSKLERQDDSTVMADFVRQGGGRLIEASDPLLNFFLPLVSPVTWYPCSFACRESVLLGRTRLQAVEQGDPGRARAIRKSLPGLTLVFDRFLFVHLHGVRRIAGAVGYDSVSDALSFVSQDSPMHEGVAGRFRSEVTRVVAAAERIAIRGNEIVLDSGERTRGGQLAARVSAIEFPGWNAGDDT